MNSRLRKKSNCFILLLAAVLMLAGCGGQQEQTDTPTIGDTRSDGTYEIYYINKDTTSIVAKDYMPTAKTSGALIDELVEQLSASKEPVNFQPPISGFGLLGHNMDNGALTLDVSDTFSTLEDLRSILVRAALVDTLCQIPGVKSVSITVNGSVLKDADGNAVGSMTPDMFVVNLGKYINSYEKTRLTLYFANKEGDGLMAVGRTVVYNSNISREKLIVEELIKGPNGDNIYPTINPAAKLVSVTSRDGVCYVNFDSAFLDEPYNIKPETAIYSLVDSLTQVAGISKVQISVEGGTSDSFMDQIPLQTVFERNLNIVE